MGRGGGVLAVVLAVVLVAGCGGGEAGERTTLDPAEAPKVVRAEPVVEPKEEPRPAEEPAQAPAAPAASPPPAAAEPPGECGEGRYERMRTLRLAHAAVARRALQAFRSPGGEPLARFGKRNANDVPTVFGVLGRVLDRDCELRWYRVQLPMKPNGIVGYVSPADVELVPVRTRILVELGARRVTVFEGGREVLRTPAAIGTAHTPTPTGHYYVDQRLRTRNAGGPFGPGAIGISAFSEVLTGWAQGGPVALHGTNRPDLIGEAVSNGCIRLPNDVVERLFATVLPGTPVVVRP